ncbi:MAG: transcriptional repressor LexA [Actinobacteria bacterium]|nr:MAG: transcriptional repressor LexA [Actinomycetota bacterium]
MRTSVCISLQEVVYSGAGRAHGGWKREVIVATRGLTKRQREILDFILSQMHRKGYPPSVREIGLAVGLSSSSTVHSHLSALERKGYIRRDPTKPRALEVLDYRDTETPILQSQVRTVPVVGRIAAGAPLLAQENIEEVFPLPPELSGEDTFVLKVTGESMIEAGILDGDWLVVRQQETATNGDIVVALLGDEATVKRFFKENGRIRLQPENSSMEPLYPEEVRVVGKAVAVLRRL